MFLGPKVLRKSHKHDFIVAATLVLTLLARISLAQSQSTAQESPTGRGQCIIQRGEWLCEGDVTASQTIIPTVTSTATTSSAGQSSIQPSPTGQGPCHLHGDHWHCEQEQETTHNDQQNSGENCVAHGDHVHCDGESAHGHEGHNHAGHSHGPSAEYGCGLAPLEEYNTKLHIGAVFILLLASLLGTTIPALSNWLKGIMSRRHKATGQDRDPIGIIVFLLQHFGGGIILSTAFVHLLSHAFVYFTNSCIGTLQFEATSPAIAMGAIWIMFVTDFLALRPLRRKAFAATHSRYANSGVGLCGHGIPQQDSERNSEEKSHISRLDTDEASLEEAEKAHNKLQKWEVLALEAGIIFHSIIIGVTIGTSSGEGWHAFLIAIAFHQFCEGIALASRITVLGMASVFSKILMYATFVITTPLGIAIGIGVRHSFNGNDRDTLLAIGILNSISAGILIYSALVQIISGDFIHNRGMLHASFSRAIAALTSFTIGALVMSILGKWA